MDPETAMELAEIEAANDAPATTAGQESHEDPWAFAGEDAGPPEDLGRRP